jgi:hypothetical protein
MPDVPEDWWLAQCRRLDRPYCQPATPEWWLPGTAGTLVGYSLRPYRCERPPVWDSEDEPIREGRR